MSKISKLIITAALATVVFGQSPLVIPFNSDNAGPVGSCVYFDLIVSQTLTISQLEINTVSLPGTLGSINVYLGPETWVGKSKKPALWAVVSSGAVVAADIDTPTFCNLNTPIILGPGVYGVALQHVGIAPAYSDGNGSNEFVANADLSFMAGAASSLLFGGTLMENRVFNGSVFYALGGTPLDLANSINFGAGCNTVQGTVYEYFPAISLSNSFDLEDSTLHFVPNNKGGYDITKTQGAAIVPPGNFTLPLGDDSVSIEYMPFLFPYPGGATHDLYVCSNGYLGFEELTSADFLPTEAKILSGPTRLMCAWMDFNPGAPGSGGINYQIDPAKQFVTITWNNVWQYGGSGFSLNLFQVVLSANGSIDIKYGTLSNNDVPCIVGFTPGNGNFGALPTVIDFSYSLPFQSGFKRSLSVSTAQRPVLGSNVEIWTENIPENALISTNMLSLSQFPLGINLALLGAPSCFQYCGIDASSLIFGNGSKLTTFGPVPMDPVWIGLSIYSQSASLSPGSNNLGVVTSNGLHLKIGDI